MSRLSSIVITKNKQRSSLTKRLLLRVQNTVTKHALWKDGMTLVIGVSSGPDSCCLLDILAALQKKHRLSLSVAHVNYRLRGKDSDEDERFVQKLAAHYKIPCFIHTPPKKIQASEEALRVIRYNFFEKTRKKNNADRIIIAHHEDDQAETILLRLLRGSGLSGLQSMQPKNDFLVRPLLTTSRADILLYLKERKLSFREDKSNNDEHYLRNRIRHTLLPLLAKNFQPNIRQSLAKTAFLVAEDYHELTKRFRSYHMPLVPPITLSRTELLSLSESSLRHTLRSIIQTASKKKVVPSKNLLFEIIAAIKSEKKKQRVVTFGGLKFLCRGDTVTLLNL
ncbi:MAG: tRNA lysidine(34) synthetase TilS [Candidatus Moranbacteria bacterium]|nr:tRNA lysidine(34) synthetase TilS [Candidatus Moranbacteria bacterium]